MNAFLIRPSKLDFLHPHFKPAAQSLHIHQLARSGTAQRFLFNSQGKPWPLSSLRVTQNAAILHPSGSELNLQLRYSCPSCTHRLRKHSLPARADSQSSRYLKPNTGEYRIAMGHDATPGAGGLVDGASGQNEERLE
jgi:hypothetical protein